MGFINIFIISLLCSVSLLSTGRIFNQLILKKKDTNFFENIIYGFIFLSFISLILNFFLSLNQLLNSTILVISLIIYFFISKKHYRNDLIFLISFAFFSVLIISFDTINRPDAGLYHFPFINILNDKQLIVGLSNLHFRYGHVSIIQYISAVYNNYLFTDNGILVPPAIILFSLLGYFIFETFKKNSDTFCKILSLIITIYILLNMNRYSSWGNDDFASIIFFIIVFESYKFLLGKDSVIFSKIILLCTVCFLIKTFYIISFLIPLSLIISVYKKFQLKKYFNINILFCFLFITLWITKGYLTTSCLFFPLEFSCFGNFDWSINSEAVSRISQISEAWSKDWPNFNSKNQFDYGFYISNFNWLSTWLNNHFLIIVDKLLIFSLIVIIIRLFVKIDINFNQKKFINLFIILLLFLTIIWFLKFPTFRYGEGIIISFMIILSFWIKLSLFSINLKKFSLILILLFGTGVLLKNSIKFYNNFDYFYVDYPWPKKNTFSKNNNFNEYNKYFSNGELVYVEPKIESNLCMYGKSPCAAIGVNKYFFGIKENILIEKGKFLIFEKIKITKIN